MKYAILVFGMLALVVFGVVVASSALDSAANGWAVGMGHVAYRDVAVAEIKAETEITLTQLKMIESANGRVLVAIMFFPLLGVSLLGMFVAIKYLSKPQVTSQSDFERQACQMEKDYYERANR